MMKKGQAFEMIVKAVIVITVAIILLLIFRGLFGSQKVAGDTAISGLTGDCDNDGIKDILDKCPCNNDDNRNTREKCGYTVNECTKIMKDNECKTKAK